MSSLRAMPRALLLTGVVPLLIGATRPTYPPRALILFVAAWCAPCRAELARLDAIVADAASFDVRVVPVDRSDGTTAMLRAVPPARVWRSAAAVDAFVQGGGSLPFSVMTDARGLPCANHALAVDTAAILAMRGRCDGLP